MQTVFGLQYDYEDQQGTVLILSKSEGLRLEDFNQIQMKMIQSNTISGQLPIEFEEIDLVLKLRYLLKGKRMLSQMLRGSKISFQSYLHILRNIVNVLENSKNYILNEQNYILSEHFIFVDKEITDISLVYIPLNEFEGNVNVKDQLRTLTTNLFVAVDTVQSTGYQQLMSHFMDNGFTLSSFKQTISKLITEPVPSQQKTDPVVNQSRFEVPREVSKEAPKEAPRSEVKVTGAKREAQKEKTVHAEVEVEVEVRQFQELQSKYKTYASLLALVASALVWKMYMDSPSEGFLYISIGFTVLFADIAFFLIKIGYPTKGIKKVKQEVQTKSKDIEVKELKYEPSNTHVKQDSKVSTEDYYKNLASQTILMSSPKHQDATILLSDMNLAATPLHPVLENKQDGKVMQLNADSFLIGRAGEAVQYPLDVQGVSRLHLEIVRSGNQHAAIDLGSLNGSFLNKVKMVSNKSYVLQDGDVITIVKMDFVFKTNQ